MTRLILLLYLFAAAVPYCFGQPGGYYSFDEFIDRYCKHLKDIDSLILESCDGKTIYFYGKEKQYVVRQAADTNGKIYFFDTTSEQEPFTKEYNLYYLRDFAWRDSMNQSDSTVKIRKSGNREIHIYKSAGKKEKIVFKNGVFVKEVTRRKGFRISTEHIKHSRFDTFKIKYNRNGYPQKIIRSFWPFALLRIYHEELFYDNMNRIIKRTQHDRWRSRKHLDCITHFTYFKTNP